MQIWTPTMTARFKALCADRSLTFRAIMETMNAEFRTDLTRNACIGKARRLQQPPREPTNNPANRVQEKKPVVKIFPFAPIQPPLVPRSRQPFKMTIYQLRSSGDCKWPGPAINGDDRPPFWFCGRPAPSGLPYCAEHSKMSYSKSRPQP